jgi:adenine-specific DNA-methyltransferase
MEKIDNGHPLSQSTDFVAQNIETLKALFPTIVKEGKIDIKELQALLGDDVETEEEYYRFTWAGKSMARREANKPSTATLRPDKESSKDWDTTQNIFIEGDNLEVLKLLQKTYANKIKIIYLDPPYNTGNDFVYKDNYNDNLGNYFAITGQVDENGKRINTNSESDGRYHSNWLNMMYPRLKLARNLLADDGVIFISIDENEIAQLQMIMKEIFAEENLIECFIWESIFRPSNMSRTVRKNSEYILAYSKSKINSLELIERFSDPQGEPSLTQNNNSFRVLRFPVGFVQINLSDKIYKSGKYGDVELMNDLEIKDNLNFNELLIKGRFKWSQEYLNSEITQGVKIIIKSESLIPYYRKDYKQTTIRPTKILPNDIIGDVLQANAELNKLFNSSIFNYPKPTSLIKSLFKFLNFENNIIILDFFAGSGTTAHSVFQMNADDGGNRKCISIQLPEPTNEKDEAYKAGYKTISEITKERIRRAGEKIKSEMKEDLFSEQGKTLDIGFRAFKLDSSNIRAWDGNPDALEDNLFNAGSNIKVNRTEADVLYEILLKYGLDLTMPIEQKELAGKQVFNIGIGALFICLGDNITTAVAEGIGKWKEELKPATSKVIFKDTGFTDVEKTNSMQILKRYGILEVNTI